MSVGLEKLWRGSGACMGHWSINSMKLLVMQSGRSRPDCERCLNLSPPCSRLPQLVTFNGSSLANYFSITHADILACLAYACDTLGSRSFSREPPDMRFVANENFPGAAVSALEAKRTRLCSGEEGGGGEPLLKRPRTPQCWWVQALAIRPPSIPRCETGLHSGFRTQRP